MLIDSCKIIEVDGVVEKLKVKRIRPYARAVMGVGIAVVSLNTATLIRRPHSPHMLTSVIPGVGTSRQMMLIPVALLQCYIWCTQWSAMYFFCTFTIAYIRTHLFAFVKLVQPIMSNSSLPFLYGYQL